MSAHQFREWQVFALLEPFEEERSAYRFALLAQILANSNRDSRKKPKPWTLEECTFRFGDDVRKQEKAKKADWQAMKTIAKSMAQSYSEGST